MSDKSRFYVSGRHVALLAILVAGVYVLLPQLGDFRSSWHLIEGAEPGPTALAVVLTFATFLAAAGTYKFLAFKPLRYGRTVAVQLAATFVNRLLPAGIGALGANYLYLRREHHSTSQAGVTVAINNLLGLTGHTILIIVVLLVFPGHALTPNGHHANTESLIKGVLAVLAIAVLAGLFFGRRRIRDAIMDVKKQLYSYSERPLSLVAAQTTSLSLTLFNVTALFFCARALDVHLSFAATLLVFSFGLGAGSAVPTPGGLGGFEAGLAAGFVAYGVEPAPALAIALLYRLISYWLTLICGGAAFIVCERRGLFTVRSAP